MKKSKKYGRRDRRKRRDYREKEEYGLKLRGIRMGKATDAERQKKITEGKRYRRKY